MYVSVVLQARTVEALFAKLEELKEEIRINRQQIIELTRAAKVTNKDSSTPTLPQDIVLPLQNYQQIEKLEKKLRNEPAVKRQMVTNSTSSLLVICN